MKLENHISIYLLVLIFIGIQENEMPSLLPVHGLETPIEKEVKIFEEFIHLNSIRSQIKKDSEFKINDTSYVQFPERDDRIVNQVLTLASSRQALYCSFLI